MAVRGGHADGAYGDRGSGSGGRTRHRSFGESSVGESVMTPTDRLGVEKEGMREEGGMERDRSDGSSTVDGMSSMASTWGASSGATPRGHSRGKLQSQTDILIVEHEGPEAKAQSRGVAASSLAASRLGQGSGGGNHSGISRIERDQLSAHSGSSGIRSEGRRRSGDTNLTAGVDWKWRMKPFVVRPEEGMSEQLLKWLEASMEKTSQIMKLAMAINQQVLEEMQVPEEFVQRLPKVRRKGNNSH